MGSNAGGVTPFHPDRGGMRMGVPRDHATINIAKTTSVTLLEKRRGRKDLGEGVGTKKLNLVEGVEEGRARGKGREIPSRLEAHRHRRERKKNHGEGGEILGKGG